MTPFIRFSMKNAVAVFLLIIMIIGGGVYSIYQMKMEKYPNVDVPWLSLSIVYPGASPEQVMEEIGKPLEKELNNLDGAVNVYSYGYPNVFHATVEFSMSKDMEDGEREMREAVSKVKLPETAKAPSFQKHQPEENPQIYSIGFFHEDLVQLQKFVKESVEPSLQTVEGVERITVSGIAEPKIAVKLDSAKLQAAHLNYDQVKQLIQANHFSFPIGDISTTDQKLPIRLDKKLQSIDDVKNIKISLPIPPNPLNPKPSVKIMKLSDIATVALEYDKNAGGTRINGKPAIQVGIVPEPGENAVKIAQEAKDKLKTLTLPKGTETLELRDQSIEIKNSVYNMLREVGLGALAAVIVTLFFLWNIRSTIIAVISIPLSMFASFLLLYYVFGYTLNMMTLAGIAVAIGRVVDDSIVVMENIFRSIRMSPQRNADLILHSTREVSGAITASTLTTVAVFVPLAFVPGLIGKYFIPLAMTIVISLLFSLLVAVTVVPLMSKLFLLRLKHVQPRENAIQRVYRRLLKWSLQHRALTLLIAVAVLAGTTYGFGKDLGFNFLPAERVQLYNVNIDMPLGTVITKTDQIAKQVEAVLKKHQDIEKISTRVHEENAGISFVVNESVLDPKPIIDQIRSEFDNIKGAKDITLSGQGGPGDARLMIVINGPNQNVIKEGAQQVTAALKNVSGVADITSTIGGEKPEITIQLYEDKLAKTGITPAQVGLALRNMVEGSVVTRAEVNGTSTDLILSIKMEGTPSIETLGKQKITTMLGNQVALKDLGRIVQVKNPLSVQHLNQAQFVQINGTITESNTGKVNADVTTAINALKLPAGVTWYTEGTSKIMNEGFINMGISLGVAVFLVFLVMLIAFGEVFLPFVILISILFTPIGAVLGLYVVGEPVGMPAMIGMLMLCGIVVTNAIVLLEKVKHNLHDGMSKTEALIEAGVTRIRPILMTAIATIGALIPLALSTDTGLISRSLAVVVIGGLTTSTLLTLVIVPVIYSLFKRSERRGVKQLSDYNRDPRIIS